MIQVKRDREGAWIAYIPKQDELYMPVHFISYKDCMEYCKIMNEQGYHLAPVTEYYLIGIPEYLNWEATKLNHLYPIYYQDTELEF